MLKKLHFFSFSLMLLLSMTLASCSQPEVNPPSVEPLLTTYLDNLHKGDLAKAKTYYFIPLHWRHQQKIYKHFNQQHQLLAEQKLQLKFLSFEQKGRWAVAALESDKAGEKSISPLWLFYYDKRWQVISPVIFKTGPVRSMIDLHREQKELRLWYDQRYNQNYPPSKKVKTQ